MRSDLFSPQNAEAQTTQPGMKLQNGKMLKVALNGEMMVRQGAMVAYQGNIQFQGQGASGVGQFVKQHLTGEGVPLMRCTGSGDMFLADLASDIHLIDLEGGHDGLTINGKNVLAFEPTLSYDIRRVQGAGMLSNAGLFNCVFSGQGRIAITTKGTPVVLQVDQPTYADPQAAVCWSASLQTGFHRADQFGLGTLHRAQHRRGLHDVVQRPGLRRRAALRGSAWLVRQRHRRRSTGRPGRFRRRGDARQLPRPLTHTARHAVRIPGGEVEQISAWSTEAPCGPS